MKVSVPASAARTPPDTGASNMTGVSQWSTDNAICQSLYMDKNKVTQTYLKINYDHVSKFSGSNQYEGRFHRKYSLEKPKY
jgi:hypothetical protein